MAERELHQSNNLINYFTLIFFRSISVFSLDGNKKLLEVISRLLELAAIYDKDPEKDPDKEMRLSIGRCIGEIGPVDFHSLALPVAEGELFSSKI